MSATWVSVLGITGLLAFAVLMLPAARKLAFPYTVLLAGVGMLLGLIEPWLASSQLLNPLGDFLSALKNLEITSEAVFFVFLPALVFEAALSIDVRRLLSDISPILMLAILGLLVSTVMVGYAVHWATPLPLLVCLLIGAICSATDPVAVVAIFKEVGAPKRLSILVEGESLFNDATAIVLFTLLAAMIAGGAEPTLTGAAGAFIWVFAGGTLAGYFFGRVLCWLMAQFSRLILVNITLSLCTAYLAFIISEHYLHVSGVMAVVTTALVAGSIGRSLLTPRHWFDMEHLWEQVGFWANSIIFILVGMAIPRLMQQISAQELAGLFAIILSALVARAFITFGLLSGLARIGLSKPVSRAYKAVMCWGGLRGAVSLALALAVAENPDYSEETRHFVVVLVSGFVMFTLAVNATTTRLIIQWLGLGNLTPVQQVVHNRAIELALDKIADEIDAIGLRQGVNTDVLAEVVSTYRTQSRSFERNQSQENNVATHDWQVAGLGMLAAMERNHYFRQFSAGLLQPQIFRNLTHQIDELSDALKSRGVEGYRMQSELNLGFDWMLRMAVHLQLKFGVTRPLATRLSERFAQLHAQHYALQEIRQSNLDKLRAMLSNDICNQLEPYLEQRHTLASNALQALSRQYPDYALNLTRTQLTQSAMWREEKAYHSLYEDGVINHDLYHRLSSEIEQRSTRTASVPPLDLEMAPELLVRNLPLLSMCSDAHIKELSTLLHPRLALPNEQLITEGSVGDAMFFIASGSVEVFHADQHYHLGTGDFFGEIALLKQVHRVADVVTSGYCKLLVLYRSDFQTFLKQNPELRAALEQTANERLDMFDLPTAS
ncbi:MAG: cation:proton antiporter [Hahellaceae bacterium]|nr:cation:proton antiporter [Hahellaceae bacterium]MCP5169961.1 cation:proton antiporter [Hahellaceae bacterium]